jgi:hypothetical protein
MPTFGNHYIRQDVTLSNTLFEQQLGNNQIEFFQYLNLLARFCFPTDDGRANLKIKSSRLVVNALKL